MSTPTDRIESRQTGPGGLPSDIWHLLQATPLGALGPDTLATMLQDATRISIADGDAIVRSGTPLMGPYVVLEGAVTADPDSSAATVLWPSDQPASAGSVIGFPDLMDDAVWPCTVQAEGQTTVLGVNLASLRRAVQAAPQTFDAIPAFSLLSRQQSRIAAALRAYEPFGAMDETVRQDIAVELPLRFCPAGTQLFVEGAPSDTIVIVVTGLLRASTEGSDGRRILLNEMGQGQSAGEIGLILDEPRRADVIAARDSIVAVIDRQTFERLIQLHPLSINRTFSRVIYNHVAPAARRSGCQSAHTFAVVALNPCSGLSWVARGLTDALSAFGTARHIPPQEDVARTALAGSGQSDRIRLLEQAEDDTDFVVYEGDQDATAWTWRSLREADHILFVADATKPPVRNALEEQLAHTTGSSLIRRSLLLLSPSGAARASGTQAWLEGRDLDRHYNLRQGHQADLERIARFITGQAVGVVLGGGGARGFAHLGVLKAMTEAGLPVDAIGGNSMGAIIAGQYALDKPLDEILTDTIALGRAGDRLTLPIVALAGGMRLQGGIRRLYGDARIEDLWRSFFTVACNLSRADVSEFDDGPVWLAVQASNSPAGLTPPTLRKGDLFVDGAIINNVPVDVMRRKVGTGTVVGVDVNRREDLIVDPALASLSPWQVLRQRLGMGGGQRLPGIVDILQRAGIIGGLAHRNRVGVTADLMLQPPVSSFSLLDYGKGAAIMEAGYRYAVDEIERFQADGE